MALLAKPEGFLIDLDGTVVEGNRLIPGAAEALAFLERRGLPYRLVTNTTSQPRSVILAKLAALGLTIPPASLFTAPVIARDYLRREGLTRCYPLLKLSLREDLEGIAFVDRDPQAVLVGDLGDELSYAALNRAFRFLIEGCAFVTLARNRYFKGTDGLCLDVGAIVAALEYGTDRTATLIGKPAPEFFLSALQSLGTAAASVAVIGDDLEADVGGAQAARLCGILVRTGKYRAEQLAASTLQPDAVLDSLAELPAWLEA